MTPSGHPYWFWQWWLWSRMGMYRQQLRMFPFAYAWLPKEWEIAILEEQRKFLKEMLNWIDKRLEDLKEKQSAPEERATRKEGEK